MCSFSVGESSLLGILTNTWCDAVEAVVAELDGMQRSGNLSKVENLFFLWMDLRGGCMQRSGPFFPKRGVRLSAFSRSSRITTSKASDTRFCGFRFQQHDDLTVIARPSNLDNQFRFSILVKTVHASRVCYKHLKHILNRSLPLASHFSGAGL